MINSHGSGRVGSGSYQTLVGRVGPGRVNTSKTNRGSGRVSWLNSTRPVKFDMSRQHPCFFFKGNLPPEMSVSLFNGACISRNSTPHPEKNVHSCQGYIKYIYTKYIYWTTCPGQTMLCERHNTTAQNE